MKDILKEMQVERFPVYLMISGFLLVLASFIRTAPSPENSWTMNLREDPIVLLFLLGVVIMFISVYLFRVPIIGSQKEVEEETKKDSNTESNQKTESPIGDNYERNSVLVGSAKWGEALEKRYMSLSRTQQRLVTFVCEMPQSQMAIDDYFKGFVGRYGKSFVANVSEIYFRLEVLELKGYCDMQKIGPGASVVSVIPEVSKCLRERDLLVS